MSKELETEEDLLTKAPVRCVGARANGIVPERYAQNAPRPTL